MIESRTKKVSSSRNKPKTETNEDLSDKRLQPAKDQDDVILMEKTHPPTTVQSTFQSREASQEAKQIQRGRQRALEGDYRTAVAIFNAISPATLQSLYYCGCARLELGDYIEIHRAIGDFDQALEFPSQYSDGRVNYKRAFAYQLIGRYTEALIDYTTYIRCNQNDTRVHKGYLSRGLVYSEIKQHEKALRDITDANNLCSQSIKYYIYCLARAQMSDNQYKEAQTTFDKLKEICHNECDSVTVTFHSYFYYGIAEYELHEYSDALEHFNQALQCALKKKDQIETLFYIGLTHYASGKVDLAKKMFEDILKQDGSYTKALFRLGMLHSHDDDGHSQALYYLTRTHQLVPHRSDILYERGELHYKMGELNACIRDKRLALQLERMDTDLSTLKHYYEFLIEQFSSMEKTQSNLSHECYLINALLLDQKFRLSQDLNSESMPKKTYCKIMHFCEQAIGKGRNDIHSGLSFAVLCTLHKNQKHAAAAMTNLDQFNDALDQSPEIENAWQHILDEVREFKEKQTTTLPEKFENIFQMNSEEMKNLLVSLLVSKLVDLQKMNTNRHEIKLDEQLFINDVNNNRKIFYTKMRSSLSHKFTAMAVTSGDGDNEPIVKHDRTGTESNIADGLGLLSDIIGGVIPVGNTVVSTAAKGISSLLKKHEYDKYQTRISSLIEDRDIFELTDLARRIARELADRYEEQLLRLKSKFDEPPTFCRYCLRICRCFRRKNKVDDSSETKQLSIESPSRYVAQFGVAFVVQTILDKNSEDIKIFSGIETNDLAKNLVELICCAKPNLTSKVLRRMNLHEYKNLPYTPLSNMNTDENLSPWYLYDFYQKPGISIRNENGEIVPQNPLSWMDANLYGYRLGTSEEYDDLLKREKTRIENKCKIHCC
ncbi:unnamed protein product [Adineta ricciae]|uniref:Uncharacterized protein n=1 Tax=Adineta ricciae TaxID=249248 RepID=A0A814UPN0_ADIRI|nr:unnamed protein product [Adineta ricciae]CAF1511189.1 unnamed protein product [Adineta ricciae]